MVQILTVVCVLLFVGCRISAGQRDCTNGFANEAEITSMTESATWRRLGRRQWIMPDISFTCNGSVTTWIVGAQWNNFASDQLIGPILQIWRRAGSQDNTYIRIRETNLNDTTNENQDQVYRFSLNPPLEFQTGDVLGLYQPRRRDSRLIVYFVPGSGPSNYYDRIETLPLSTFVTTAQDVVIQNALPLVSVVVSTSLTSSANLQSTPTRFPPETSSSPERIQSTPGSTSSGFNSFNQAPLTSEQAGPVSTPDSSLQSGNTVKQHTFQMPSMEQTVTVIPLPTVDLPGTGASLLSLRPAPTTPQPTRPVDGGVGEHSSSSSGSSSGLIAGVIAAVVVVIIVIVLGFIILAKFIFRSRKRAVVKFNTNGCTHINNPVYTDNPGLLHGGLQVTAVTSGTGTAPDAIYEDARSCGVYQTNDDAQREASLKANCKSQCENQGAGRKRNIDSNMSDEFAQPPSQARYENQGTGRKRNIYSNMSDEFTQPPSETASFREEPVQKSVQHGGEARSGIHVPTQEQRKIVPDLAPKSEVHGNTYASLAEMQQCSSFFEETGTYWKPSSDPHELYDQLASKKYREIPRSQIQITAHLGGGQFGTVNKGIWQSLAGATEVAIKTLRQESSKEVKVKFLQEAAINGQFRHINVVKLLGVVTLDEPVMIVLELLGNGDLREYLIKQRPVPGELVSSDTPQMFLRFCQQIASGMEYLSEKAFVHRDLAARNILLSDDKTCKISDFGMSRDLADENYYIPSHGGKIPVRWTSPEALHFNKYSTASDVWSYGVLMYEVWSLGHKPFTGYTNAQTIRLIDNNYRLPPPPGCPKEMYRIMIHCWHTDRSTRPTFSQLSGTLSKPETELLGWSEEDLNVHSHAMILGATLDAGKDLYPNLQQTYK